MKMEAFSKNEKNELMNYINKAIETKKKIEDFQRQINELFEEVKKNMDEIIFLKNLIFSYESQQKYFIYNYNITNNLKKIKSIVKLNNIKKVELISKYSNKLINLLQKGNYKTITKHTHYIDYIKILPDNRLLSCSEDGQLIFIIKKILNLNTKLMSEVV